MKKKLSDIVLQRISPPDEKPNMTVEDLSGVLVKRLGLTRKESRARHAQLLLELFKYRKDSVPVSVEQISKILQVSQSQAYEELRKWRSLGLLEFVKVPAAGGFVKGYLLTANTCNRLMDKVESSLKSFMRKTRRISKDMDDLLMLEIARSSKPAEKEDVQGQTDVPEGNDEESAEE